MSSTELQEEEREVLLSIYEGDENFFDLAPTKYQYKIGENGESKSFLVEVSWGDNYPDDLPSINLDLFYNKHIVANVKADILEKLKIQAEELLGSGSTYTVFEFCKENVADLLSDQPEASIAAEPVSKQREAEPKQEKLKKETLTKNQKKRLYDKFGTAGMTDGKQRGWNWVDVVKHLLQTGSKDDQA